MDMLEILCRYLVLFERAIVALRLASRHPAPGGNAGCEPYQEVRHVS